MMSTCLITEVKQQWATLELMDGGSPQCTTSVSDGFALVLVGLNPVSVLFSKGNFFFSLFSGFFFFFFQRATLSLELTPLPPMMQYSDDNVAFVES